MMEVAAMVASARSYLPRKRRPRPRAKSRIKEFSSKSFYSFSIKVCRIDCAASSSQVPT
jgi:hypothetical protein